MRLFIDGNDLNTDLYVRSQLSDIELTSIHIINLDICQKQIIITEIIHNA